MNVPALRPSTILPRAALAVPPLLCALAAVAAAAGVLVLGPTAAVVPLAILAIATALAWPQRFVVGLLICGIAIDPAEVGITGILGKAVWDFPPAINAMMPLKSNPFEVLLALCAVGICFRQAAPQPGARLPAVAWAVPLVILAGVAFGLAHGGPLNLAYHESRGLIYRSEERRVGKECA